MTIKKKICVIISLYNPCLERLAVLIPNLLEQTDLVILVDNSSDNNKVVGFEYDKVKKISQDNSGITGAMNSGIKYAGNSFDYFLLLDQDSYFSSVQLSKFIEDAIDSNYPIIAPTIVNSAGKSIHDSFFKAEKHGDKFSLVARTQLSGMLIKYEVLGRVGLFNEDYFLNLGDTEWCLRAKKQGYDFRLNNCVQLVHDYGDGFSSLFGYKFFYGAPFRLHYRSRDSLRLIFSCVSSKKLKFKLFMKLCFTLFEILTLDSKLKRYKFFFSGIRAFFKQESGIMK
ncbi:glycosyltransferase [Shewanella sp. 10N.261.52.F9]|uniref:glycosyltransferase n=1 Tax=Shewanella sp. 10N.261.52.F9 TaxID=3229684 RepID=UPI00354BFE52